MKPQDYSKYRQICHAIKRLAEQGDPIPQELINEYQFYHDSVTTL